MTRLLQPVIWSKGTFLSPQHLQAQERFIEDSASFYRDSLNPKAWGFSRLNIDTKALAEGMLSLTVAAGIFPDSLVFDVPKSDPPPPARSLDECFREGQKSREFFLTIPQHLHGGMNIAMTPGTVNTRFSAALRMLRDENLGSNERPVQVACKNLRILAQGENLDASILLGCVCIRKSDAGNYKLDETYIPPLIDIHAHAQLLGLVGSMLELLISRSAQLAGSRRQKNQSLADFSASDVANFWLLYTINTHLPALRHLFESAQVHPLLLFKELSDLAGSLTTFSINVEPRDVPTYDHERLGTCFRELDRLIRLMLDTVIPSNFVALPLKLSRDTIYAAAIEKDAYFENSKFYVAVSADVRDAELVDRVPRLLKAASASEVDTLIRMALPGLGLKHVATPPRAIPVNLRQQYFAIDQSGRYWDAVRRERNFAVHAPKEIPNPQMELIILLPQVG